MKKSLLMTACSVGLFVSTALTPVSAQTAPGVSGAGVSGPVSGDVLTMIEKAAARDNGAHLPAVALIAIEADPARAQDILAAIRAIAPGQEQAVRDVVRGSLPDVDLGQPTAVEEQRIASTGTAAAPAETAKTEAEEQPKKPGKFWQLSGWKGNLELSAARSTGNTRQTSLGTAANASREFGKWTHKFNGLIDFERSAGTTTKRRWLASYDPRYAISDRAYVFGIFQYEADKFSGFDYRFAETLGLGYRLIQTDRFIFDVEAGPGMRQTKFITGDTENEFAATGRTHLEWVISETASFTHDFLYVWGSNQQTIDTTAALKMRIYGALSGRLSYNYRYNTDVPVGNVKTDTVTRASLVYDF